MNYLIVGAGLFGAVCARELTDKGNKVIVIEKRDHVGGNIYTKEIEGINVHFYGAHIFHTSNEDVWNYVQRFVPFYNFINSPIAVYKNSVYNLPFNMNTFCKLWDDVVKPSEAACKIENERKDLYVQNPKNLEEQAINLVGKTIYEKLIKGYTAKQWGRPCSQLPPEIIKRVPVRFTYDNNYFNDIYQGIPIGGYTKLIQNLLDGIEVIKSTPFDKYKKSIDLKKYCVIYTGPIDEFFDFKYGRLEYRSLVFEHKIIDIENYQGNAVVNYTDVDVPYTRIIEHKHFEKTHSKKTVITFEYPAKMQDGFEPYYPINDNRNNSLYQKYCEEALKLKNVYFGGRLGMYRYADMDDTIESALNLVSLLEKNIS